jgi:hypothetical protein
MTQRSTRTKAEPSDVMYIRIPRTIYVTIKAEAERLGWPHTIASVAGAALSKAFNGGTK